MSDSANQSLAISVSATPPSAPVAVPVTTPRKKSSQPLFTVIHAPAFDEQTKAQSETEPGTDAAGLTVDPPRPRSASSSVVSESDKDDHRESSATKKKKSVKPKTTKSPANKRGRKAPLTKEFISDKDDDDSDYEVSRVAEIQRQSKGTISEGEQPKCSRNVSSVARPRRTNKPVNYRLSEISDDSDETQPKKKKSKVDNPTRATRNSRKGQFTEPLATPNEEDTASCHENKDDDDDDDNNNEKVVQHESVPAQNQDVEVVEIEDSDEDQLAIDESGTSNDKDQIEEDGDHCSGQDANSAFPEPNELIQVSQSEVELANENEIIHVPSNENNLEQNYEDSQNQEVRLDAPLVADAPNVVQNLQSSLENENLFIRISSPTSQDDSSSQFKRKSLFLKMMETSQKENDFHVFDIPIKRNIKNPEYKRLSSITLKIWDLKPMKEELELFADHEYYDYLFQFLHFGMTDIKDGKKLTQVLSYLLLNQICKPYISALFAIQTLQNLSVDVFKSFLDHIDNVDFKEYYQFIRGLCLVYILNNSDPSSLLSAKTPKNIKACVKRLSGDSVSYDEISDNLFKGAKSLDTIKDFINMDLKQKYLKAEENLFILKSSSYPYMYQFHVLSLLYSNPKQNTLLLLLKDVFDYKSFVNFSIKTQIPNGEKEKTKIWKKIFMLFSNSKQEILENKEFTWTCNQSLNRACEFLYKKMLDYSSYDQLPPSEIIDSVLFLCDSFKLRDARQLLANGLDTEQILIKYSSQLELVVPFFMNSGQDAIEESSNLFIRNSKEWFTKEIVCRLSEEILSAILQSDNLYAEDELNVAVLCLEWAKAQSESKQENIQAHFNKVKHFIRFPLINVYTFKEKFVPFGLLDMITEVSPIILASVIETTNCPFSSKRRTFTKDHKQV